ncbi:uncharacterized protein LOC123541463 isoform X2 [Mercenaria mercenaria]|uniref:uncharacterized protein LOC123541463 isoform X2 n=1 Tax=Mercenaria mercenaria TaxID=6596 RepID=UPI00234F9285|nr:uncharacterized protein LOC123541463 isoform X2 [Mercenaria mercenaria]
MSPVFSVVLFLHTLLICAAIGKGGISWNRGKNFLLVFPDSESGNADLKVYLSAKEITKVFIEAPETGLHSNYTLQIGTQAISINKQLELHGSGSWRKGIHVISDKDISIYAVSQQQYTSDGFLVLPYTAMSTEFYVVSYTVKTKSEFAVVAATDDTTVNVTFSTTAGRVTFEGSSYANGQTLTYKLNRLSALQIQHSHDLTGTHVQSDKAIAVVSGSKCAYVPSDTAACDIMLEVIPPVHTWRYKYITAAFKTRLHNRIRIISGHDGNTIKLGNIKQFTLNRGQFSEQIITTDIAVLLECTKPCLLVQYSEGSTADGGVGDPFMALIPSLDQFSSEYYFKTPNLFDSHYLTIVIPTNKVSGLRLDGASLVGQTKTVTASLNGRSESYSVIRVAVSHSSHHIAHASGEPFGAILYGFAKTESYGYPLGINIFGISGVRLLNESSSKSGLLEVSFGGMWTSVCSSAVSIDVARLICRTLGYDKYNLSRNAVQVISTVSSDLQHLSGNITCAGNEASLEECSVSQYIPETCTSVAGIDCAPSLQELVHSKCTSSTWDIAVDMDKLNYRFPGSLPGDIYLGDNTCTGIMQGNQLLFRHDIHGCVTTNTATKDEIIYSNQLVYAYHDPQYHFIIRNFNWTININCHISRNQAGHSQVTYNQSTDTSQILNSTSQYEIDTLFFLDPNFKQPTSGSPLQVPVGTNVFVKSYVRDVDWTIKMRLHSCYTTTSAGSNNMKYYLIKNGCEVDANTHLLSQTDHETKLVFQTFEMTGIHGDLYIKCDAVFCDTSDSASSQQCDTACRQR